MPPWEEHKNQSYSFALKGPAFQPMPIENWREFQSMFGGTSTEKFRGSQYPKYELPYIAKSYLKESNQLQVCRVLGLSGYNAGPAWVIAANTKDDKLMPIVVLRSRGHYEMYHKFGGTTGTCECPQETYDQLFYTVGEWNETDDSCNYPKEYNQKAVWLDKYVTYDAYGNECEGYNPTSGEEEFTVSPLNHGKFKICGLKGSHERPEDASEFNPFTSGGTLDDKYKDYYFEYPVSLNEGSKDYILKVLGITPQDGDAPLYVESLYDVALTQMIESGDIVSINKELVFYQVYNVSDYDYLQPVASIVSMQEEALTRKDIGKRFLADKNAVDSKIHCHPYDYKTNMPKTSGETLVMEYMKIGQIYTVAQYTDESGKRHYFYKYYDKTTFTELEDAEKAMVADELYSYKGAGVASMTTKERYKKVYNAVVLNLSDNRYYRLINDDVDVAPVTCDMNNYKDSYRFASTPWIVSNVKGDYDTIELTKLFRFHTISDGNNANNEIKISIQNIKTEDGTFDVVVRDINDVDESPVVLEKFTKCSMKPGDYGFISYKIGSYDGLYESKSKYITVEVNESLAAQTSVPAGFMGYPLSNFGGMQVFGIHQEDVINPQIKYNLTYNQDVKNRKQYFGLSNSVGVDIDMFTYKGKVAYGDEPEYLSQGFHLDSRLDSSTYQEGEYNPTILVDGEKGYTFDGISINNRTLTLSNSPIIGTEAEMIGSIYENVDLRKFTMYFYGGFDGWDVYREYRSNTDDFKLSKYRGQYNEANGEGVAFNKIENTDSLNLNQVGMTSDWYAYLAAIRQFANPESVDINVFATPGIDIINNKTLVEEVIEMIEEERADSIYVATMPDKPFGASDYVEKNTV